MDSKTFLDYTAHIREFKNSYFNLKCKELNLSRKDMPYLGLLHDKGSLSQNEIAAIMGVDKAYISRSLASLEEKGLVKRVEQTDNRKKVYSITPYGESLGKQIDDDLQKFISEVMFSGVSKEEQKIFCKVFDLMKANAKKYFEKGENNETDIKDI